jgi:predicted nuclease of predicted toxin-antitoxin system
LLSASRNYFPADADFVRLADTLGPPPKAIRLENCNYKTSLVEELLRRNAIRIADLDQSDRPILIIPNPAVRARQPAGDDAT